MSDLVVATFVLMAAYLVGAIPFGVLLGKIWRGIDIRRYGSGGTGATNVARTLGPRAGAAVLASDVTKGLLVTGIARYVIHADPWVIAAAGTVTVLGHMFPAYIGFKGGKGVATGFGALLIVSPIAAVIAMTGVAIAALTRYVSLGSIIGSAVSLGSLAVFSAFEIWGHDLWYLLFAIPVATMIIWSHHANIDRLAKGGEARLEGAPTPRRVRRTP
ncbi:MAG: glycerol-3-phosphate 1-O-acyltransferase PlsY [Chloroflexi bacterium]|nr:glycerol-3-phosphate 1-O-acyltransferase PlsY [Chloroflexota bacterium]